MADIRKLTAKEQVALDALAAMPDSEVDTSEMPEVTDWSGAVRGGFYRSGEAPHLPTTGRGPGGMVKARR